MEKITSYESNINVSGSFYSWLYELLLPDSYFTMNNPYEQIDIIVNSLEQLSKIEFSEVFQESQDKILENKVLLLEHYKKIGITLKIKLNLKTNANPRKKLKFT